MVTTTILAVVLSATGATAQSAPRPKFEAFDVATIKPVDFDAKGGRYIQMEGTHRFVEKGYTVKLLIAAAYDLNPHAVLGGPGWIDSDHYDIVAVTPGDVQPNHAEQMSMLRNLLADRFKLTFHREQKEFSSYVLEVGKSGPKLKPSILPPDAEVKLISVVYPQRIVMPARNATMGDFVSLLQRAVLDRPVVDRTGLPGRYDFDLEWAPDETQFSGSIPAAPADAAAPPLFTAMQEQLGLRLYATKAPVPALVVDAVEHPSAN
jgi:uncharacterized protein (TIGR03435 family)